MILRTAIFEAVIETAKAKVAGNEAWGRAIDRAVVELKQATYWHYDPARGVLKIKSTTSGKLYQIDDRHACEATKRGFKTCKHVASRQIMKRYYEKLQNA